MRKHDRLFQALAALCGLCAFLCMTASAAYSAVVSRGIMRTGFQRYAQTESFGVGADQYDAYAGMITSYLAGKTDQLNITDENGLSRAAFSEKENLHMEDVRGLVRLLHVIRLVAGALFFGLTGILLVHMQRRGDGPSLLRGAALGAGLFLLLGAGLTFAAVSDFDRLFIAFHRLFFHNNLWLLNPQTDLLIALMPETFFVWYGGEILRRLLPVAALAAVLIIAAIYLSGHPKREKA